MAAFVGVLGLAAAEASAAGDEQTRYSLVGNCYSLQLAGNGPFVAKDAIGYGTVGSAGGAERFRMQATDLGKYLLYGTARDFLATATLGNGTQSAPNAIDAADWTVDGSGGSFTITNDAAGKGLAVSGAGRLVVSDSPAAFSFVPAEGCPAYPEIEVNATGAPTTAKPLYGETSGLVDGHMHGMAFEFLGGRAHCGKPWDRFGAPYALVDCPDHSANHAGAILENGVSHDDAIQSTDGWPTFAGWPDDASLTHEGSYYKWIERSWRGGQRIFVNLLVENRVLCELYPLKKNSCNEMDSVRLQAHDMYKFQDYIDAQNGGPGEGWYRIVKNPFQARRVINQGKLAVIMGMEVSEPFNCRLVPPNAQPAPGCNGASIDRQLDELHDLGVRQLELTNKFDNALTGVAGDNGATGALTNTGNFLSTGKYLDLEHCDDPDNSDRETLGITHNDDDLIGNGLAALLPPGAAPVYPEPPVCNRRALSNLGVHAIRTIMSKGMIFDPDHMSVYGRDQAMNLLEANRYSGVVSSHSWSTERTLKRIYALGGMVTPYAGDSESFVKQWEVLRADRPMLGKQYYGVGYGADQNGLGSQGGPRGADVPNPVTYPFENWNGDVTLDHQQSGTRSYDINADGVDHYGLYPDWVEDLRQLAGDQIIEDMGRGSEAYLQMWERASGIEKVSCDVWHGQITAKRGIAGERRVGDRPRKVLERAGQPLDRHRAWRWCARGRPALGKRHRRVFAVFSGSGKVALALSTMEKNEAGGVAKGDHLAELRASGASKLGRGFWVRRAGGGKRFFYRLRGGRVRYVGLGSRKATKSGGKLARAVRRTGLS